MGFRYTVLYILLIVAVNYGFSVVPLVDLPGGEKWPPMSLVVGLIFVARDFAQREIGHRVIIAMLVAGVISYVMADPFVATASVAAFLISEFADWAVYSFTGRPFSQRILLSSAIGTPVDSVVFLGIIGHLSVTGVIVMTLSKMVGAFVVWQWCGGGKASLPEATTTVSEASGKKAVVLLSGGLDSTTVLALALRDGFDVAALTFDYGQRHALELRAARDLAERSGLRRHAVVSIDLRAYGGSALTDDIRVPKGRSAREIGEGIPVTYVPARNTIFLAHALALAEVEDARDIFIGVNALDYSGYPDCRPAFIEAFQTMANLATKAATENDQPIEIRTPLMDMTKAEIIDLGIGLGVDYAHTLSCYDPVAEEDEHGRVVGSPLHCGACDACLLRKKGFAEAGIPDPTPYLE